ncbi:helix-turn-helix domain-containing protein [Psychrobacter maritimus]|uniref:helix-turn-helix domain-containing protein n=1 Tax=Psychrobacter maritimus TaxID=256325 RepID=UPI0039AF6AAE
MNNHLIRPIQPYFRIHTHKSYQAKYVNYDGISHFYSFVVDDSALAVNVVPDGSIDIIFKLHDDKPEAWICGSSRKLCNTLIERGCFYFGVRYQIGVMPTFLPLKPKDIIDQSIPLCIVYALAELLIEKISDCNDFEQKIRTFSQVCSKQQFLQHKPELSQTLIKLMLYHRGNISISELSHHSGYSARTISNSFNDYYGMSPKALNMTFRYQQSLKYLMEKKYERLTDLAACIGYSDQSHFLRQFKRYNGQGPKEFQSTLRKNLIQD